MESGSLPVGRSGGLATMFTASGYRWVVWSILVVTYMVAFFHRMSVSVVMDPLTERFGFSSAEFGAMASMYFYAYCVAQIPAGVLADSIGVRLTAGLSMLVAAVATVSFGYASSVPVLYASRFAVGIGVAACFVCVMKVQSQWYHEREFSTLAGICLFGGNLGSLGAQAPLALLVAALSFEHAFLAVGGATMVLGGLCFVLVRNKPEDMGFAPVVTRPAAPGTKTSLGRALAAVARNRRLNVMFLYYFLVVPQFLAFGGTWSVAYLRDTYGLSLASASRIASVQVVCFMLGSLLLGLLSDRAGKRKPFIVIPSLFLMALWTLLALGNEGLALAAFIACLGGVGFFAGTFSVMMAMCKELGPREFTGTAIAALNTFGFLAIALATPVYGRILDASGGSGAASHKDALLFLAVLTGLGFLVSLLLRETNGRNAAE